MTEKFNILQRFHPRGYQIPFLESMDKKNRACWIVHRKGGKTLTLFNFAVNKSFARVGAIYHAFPEYGQGRKVLWDGMDNDGNRIIDFYAPKKIRKNTNNTEMKIEFLNGSIYQIIGADNYDSLVGPNPVGLILDEWAVSDKYPKAWDYFRPILAQNRGWAVFVYTPRGRNHGFDLYQMAQTNPAWFCQLLTVEDTHAVDEEAIQAERKANMPESMIRQEFYCDFIASVEDVLIPFHLIQGALRRDTQSRGVGRIAGLDVARFGDDRTALIIRQGSQLIHAESWKGVDTAQTAGKVIDMYRNLLFDCVAIDVIGLGAGVYDMAKNAEVPCVGVNVGEATAVKGRFTRMRDELWWKVREWFQDLACSISPGIPKQEINALVADIQDIRYGFTNKGTIKIESKEDMKERLGFSPDYGDALCCTFARGIEMKVNAYDRILMGSVRKQSESTYDPLHFGLA